MHFTARRRSPRLAAAALAAAYLLLSAALAPALAAQPSLQTLAEQHIRAAEPGGALVGVLFIDADSGEELIAVNADKPMIPASNMKLVTTAAALATLGEQFAFTTKLRHVGDDLVIFGDGDPGFGDPELLRAMDLDADDLIDRWAAAVKKTGRDHFAAIVVDDRVFESTMVHPQWPTNQLHKWYCAQVAAINFNDNCLDVYARPGKPGERPAVWYVPSGAPIDLDNTAVSGKDNAIWISRQLGGNRLVVRGTVPYELRTPVNVTVHDPPLFFAETLRRRLRAQGVKVDAVRRADESELLTGGALLAMVQTPLATVVRRCNKDSQNLFAECMFKRMGHRVSGQPGSWDNGAAAVRMFLSRTLGTDAAHVVISDGSGMSRDNRISPRVLTRLLGAMDKDPKVGDLFRNSLARPGEGGTLEKRFRDYHLKSDLYAKSGYLNNVICLSGYMTVGDRTVLFSVLVNDYTKGAWRAYKLTEQIIADVDKRIAADLAEPAKLGG